MDDFVPDPELLTKVQKRSKVGSNKSDSRLDFDYQNETKVASSTETKSSPLMDAFVPPPQNDDDLSARMEELNYRLILCNLMYICYYLTFYNHSSDSDCVFLVLFFKSSDYLSSFSLLSWLRQKSSHQKSFSSLLSFVVSSFVSFVYCCSVRLNLFENLIQFVLTLFMIGSNVFSCCCFCFLCVCVCVFVWSNTRTFCAAYQRALKNFNGDGHFGINVVALSSLLICMYLYA